MVLPRNGFVQPVEMVAGGPLPRNGFVQPVEVIGGAPSSASPVAGGSGQFYASITAAIAGEVQTVVSGLVPQAGTGPGVIVGPGTLSAVDNFYKDMFVLNTSLAPSNGLVAQWARVSSYVGATRTFTIDKPWDFSAEANFEVVDPVRVMVFLDIQEDVTVNKNFVLDLGGNRLQGKVDISSADICWIRGGGGFITNGIQKADFGLLKVDNCAVSRRDATIYALLLTNGSNLGRCELGNCELFGRVAGRRGQAGWSVVSCRNMGAPTFSTDCVPYALVESVAGVSIALTQLDVYSDSEFCGSIIYSENSVTGGAVFLSVFGVFKLTQDYATPDWTPKKFFIAKAVGAGVLDVTTSTGWIAAQIVGMRGALTSPSKNIPVAGLFTVESCSSTSQLILTGIQMEMTFDGYSLVRFFYSEGTSDSSGTFTLGGTAVKRAFLSGSNTRILEFNGQVTGSLTVSGGAYILKGGGTVGHGDFDIAQAGGAPTFTISVILNVSGSDFNSLTGTNLISVGTWTISGIILTQTSGSNNPYVFTAAGGTFTYSGTFEMQAACIPAVAFLGGMNIVRHAGSGGTVSVSGNITVNGGNWDGVTVCRIDTAGATANVTSASVTIFGCNVFVDGSGSGVLIVVALTATSIGTVTGAVSFANCSFKNAHTLVSSSPGGASITGPSSVIFENCGFSSTLDGDSGAGTITWTNASLTFRNSFVNGLVTLLATHFTTIEAFNSHFNGNASNKTLTVTGTRPATYRFWKCSFAARYDDLQPETLDVYDILPAQAALVRGQPVKVNATNQYQVCVAASVVDGALLAAAGGAGTIAIAIRQGRAFVKVNAAVANGDNLVLDTVTPTQAVTAAAVVVGQGIGTALEAAGATVAGLAYTAVNVR